jgi:hypothetical protein
MLGLHIGRATTDTRRLTFGHSISNNLRISACPLCPHEQAFPRFVDNPLGIQIPASYPDRVQPVTRPEAIRDMIDAMLHLLKRAVEKRRKKR